MPDEGETWAEEGQPQRQGHKYLRDGIAKCSGEVRVKGVTHSPNPVLQQWLQAELRTILETLPSLPTMLDPSTTRVLWERWQAGLSQPVPLPDALPPRGCS